MQNPSVEHLDLELKMTNSVQGEFRRALDEFLAHYHYQVIQPKWREETLLINSKDFIELSGYVDPHSVTVLELARIKRTVERQLKMWLQKSSQPSIRYHYNWCLTALHNFKWGRHALENNT